jgi:multidrug resistance efflux pump
MPSPSLTKVLHNERLRPKPPGGRRRSRSRIAFVLAASLLLLVSLVCGLMSAHQPDWRQHLITHTVRPDRLQISVREPGTLAAAVSTDVFCRVKSRSRTSSMPTTFTWIIEEGTPVQRGDIIARLDSTGLEEDVRDLRILVFKARADWLQAEENCKIVRSQNEGDTQSAAVAAQLADLDLAEYRFGDYEQTRKDIEGRISTASADAEMWSNRAAWSARMQRKGFTSQVQAEGEQNRLEGAQIALDNVREEERVLAYTVERTLTDLRARCDEAHRALTRVRFQAKAREVQAEADRLAKRRIHLRREQRIREIQHQVDFCTIRAPSDGIVVYDTPEQSRYKLGAQQGIIAIGEPVREGQRIMQIPNLDRTIVNTRIHETMLAHFRGEERGAASVSAAHGAGVSQLLPNLLDHSAIGAVRGSTQRAEESNPYPGDQVLIQVHALPDQFLHGHIKRIATLPSYREWLLTDAKVYPTVVAVDEAWPGLKPGMMADVTILSGQPLENVLAVPTEAMTIPPKAGEKSKLYVLTPNGPEEREVTVGLASDSLVQVKNGVEDGEEVVLNPESLAHKEVAKIEP